MATAGDRERSRQLLLDASEEVDGVREWDGPPRRYLGVVRVAMGVRSAGRSADSEWRQDEAAEGDLAPLWWRGPNASNGLWTTTVGAR